LDPLEFIRSLALLGAYGRSSNIRLWAARQIVLNSRSDVFPGDGINQFHEKIVIVVLQVAYTYWATISDQLPGRSGNCSVNELSDQEIEIGPAALRRSNALTGWRDAQKNRSPMRIVSPG
jgi:hypothetical protein